MVNILAPVVTTGPIYVKAANVPGLYRHARSGRYYTCKKQGGIRRERSLGTCDRKIAERKLKEWIGNLDKVTGSHAAIQPLTFWIMPEETKDSTSAGDDSKFPLGQVVATRTALASLPTRDIAVALARASHSHRGRVRAHRREHPHATF